MTPKKFAEDYGWPISIVFVICAFTGLISWSAVTNITNFRPSGSNAIATCPPGCGMSPWIFQHPFFFIGVLGVICVVVLIAIIISFIFYQPPKKRRNP